MSEVSVMPDMSGMERTRRWVDKYCSSERHLGLAKFTVHGPFTLPELWKSNAANKPGCYLIFGENGRLRYIGMSVTNVGDRIGSHFSPATQQSKFWADGPRPKFVAVIEVVNPWEAPSLEQYLITHTDDIVYRAGR
jgi:hypothetical protein